MKNGFTIIELLVVIVVIVILSIVFFGGIGSNRSQQVDTEIETLKFKK